MVAGLRATLGMIRRDKKNRRSYRAFAQTEPTVQSGRSIVALTTTLLLHMLKWHVFSHWLIQNVGVVLEGLSKNLYRIGKG